MRYVTRNEHGQINGSYFRQQYPGQERLADDNPELVAFTNPPPAFGSEIGLRPTLSETYKQLLISKEKYWRK